MKTQKLKSKMVKLQKVENILLFLTLLFLPTQLGRHFWPQFSYIYSLKIDYLSPTLYFWDILVIGFLLVWILGRPKVNKTALSLTLFFLLTQALSLFGANNIGAGLVRLEQYTVTAFFGVFLASTNFKSLSGRIFLPLSLGVIAESLIAILQITAGSTLGLWILGERTFTLSTPGIAKFDFYGMQFLRPYATFPHPNVLAGFMLVVIVILKNLSVIARRESSTDVAIRRGGFLTSLGMTMLMAGLAIFLSMSRTVILAGVFILAILLRRKWIIFKSINRQALFIIIIILIFSPVLFTRFSSLLNFDNLTLIRREELIGNAWQMFLKSPIFGVGLNNFIPAQAANLITGPSRFLQPVHNIFFLDLAETGIIGLVGFILLIGIPILSSLFSPLSSALGGSINNYLYGFPIRSRLRRGHSTLSVSGMTIAWLIILFLGMFDHYFLTLPQGYRLLFLVWGLSFSVLK